MKRILVTGGSGFLGRHVVEACKAKGWETVGYHRRRAVTYSDGTKSELCSFNGTREIFEGDYSVMADVVVHCAGSVGGIGKNVDFPFDQIEENGWLGWAVTEMCTAFGGLMGGPSGGHLINIGSCCQYPKNAPMPYREESMWDGYPEPTNGPYGIAKRFVCDLARAAHEQYGLGYTNLVLANLYGPGDKFDLDNGHVVASLVRKFVEAESSMLDRAEFVEVWGDGTAQRELLHVRDAATAIVRTIEEGPLNDTFNVGSAGVASIAQVAHMISREMATEPIIKYDTDKPTGVRLRVMDSTKFRERTGWAPTVTLPEGIKETVEWYRLNSTATPSKSASLTGCRSQPATG